MLSRVLLNDDTWLMSIRWLGLGKLEVSHLPSGRFGVAPPALKSHFINTMQALSDSGVSLNPSQNIVKDVMRTYAELVLNPEGLAARTVMSQAPEAVVKGITDVAEQDFDSERRV